MKGYQSQIAPLIFNLADSEDSFTRLERMPEIFLLSVLVIGFSLLVFII